MSIIVKTKKQIEGIRKSCQLAAKTLKCLEPFIVPGITTNEINDLAAKFIVDNGAIAACKGYNGFPKETCISVNEVVCHGIPSEVKLVDGDIVNVDVTTILDGYYGDTSTMFAIGNISDKAKRLIEVTKKALEIGVKHVKPGGRFGDIGYYINKYVTSQGFNVVTSYCGHGCGLCN